MDVPRLWPSIDTVIPAISTRLEFILQLERRMFGPDPRWFCAAHVPAVRKERSDCDRGAARLGSRGARGSDRQRDEPRQTGPPSSAGTSAVSLRSHNRAPSSDVPRDPRAFREHVNLPADRPMRSRSADRASRLRSRRRTGACRAPWKTAPSASRGIAPSLDSRGESE